MLFVTSPDHYYFAIEDSVSVDPLSLCNSGCVIHANKDAMYIFVMKQFDLELDEVIGHEIVVKRHEGQVAAIGDRGGVEVVEDGKLIDFLKSYTL